MAISLKQVVTLVDRTAEKLNRDFKFKINLDGLRDTADDLEYVLDVDYETLRELNKDCLYWYSYLSELNSLFGIFIDRYRNSYEVYEYLKFLSKKDKILFMKTAPKYKISTRDFDKSVIELDTKISELKGFIKDLNNIYKFIESFRRYMKFHYYRTSRLISKSYVRFKNSDI